MSDELIQMISDSLSSLLEEHCTPELLRGYESTGLTGDLWGEIEALGFVDLMLPEQDGGADLPLSALFELVFMFGKHLLPVPLSDTLIARALLHGAGKPLAAGSIVLASCKNQKDAITPPVMYASVAQYALVEHTQKIGLVPLEKNNLQSTTVDRSLTAVIDASAATFDGALTVDTSLEVISAALRAAEMAGMLARVLELTVEYANERSQFGKKIGRFQAIQQQIAVLAEEVAAARMAAKMAFKRNQFERVSAATAKMRAGSATKTVLAIAHAVHGAMGFSEEYDLQLYSRRLIEARFAYGSDSYWAKTLGAARMASVQQGSLDFVLTHY
jgi:acyl-CoA dehydrogenase